MIIMSPDWTPANMTFQVSNDNVYFVDLYDSAGNEILRPVGADRAIMVDTSLTQATLYAKVRSGPAINPVPQNATRDITLILV
jgi:hypothetical protein